MIDLITGLIDQYSTTLTLIVGAVAITGALWRLVLRPMLIALRELAEQMQALRTVAEAQLTENGGGSLLDKVNQIAPNHAKAETHWKALEDAQDEITKRLKAIEDKPSVVVNNLPPGGGE